MGVVLVFASVLLSVVCGEQGAAKSVSRVLLALNKAKDEGQCLSLVRT